jgi:hypothetical protein
MFDSCLYVSRSNLSVSSCAREVADLVERAESKNGRLGVTGSIIFTGTYFAQIIEGLTASIDDLMASIVRDPRHSGLRIVTRTQVQARDFGDWTMAYSGPSAYMNRHIQPLATEAVEGSENANRSRRLTTLMRRLTTDRG